MAAGDLITTDMQVEWNNVLIGTGTRYVLQKIGRGLDLSDLRTSDTDRTRQHGMTPGIDRVASRTIELEMYVLGTTNIDLEQKLSALVAALTVDTTEAPLVWQRPGQTKRRAMVRLRRMVYPVDIPFGMRQANVAMQFFATDPFLYGNDLQGAVTSRTQPGGGFTPPFTPPFSLAASVGGALTIDNDGNAPAPWTARLDGPLTYPAITHLETGRRLSLDLTANGGIDLQVGQWVDLDSARRSVLLNGTADRRTQLTIDSEWWALDPGPNTVQLDADAGSGTLTVSWRDAFYS